MGPVPARSAGLGTKKGVEHVLHTRPGLGYYQNEVEGRMAAGEPFGQVESYINEAGPLAELERAALWLLAWSMRDSSAQRQDARATLLLLHHC